MARMKKSTIRTASKGKRKRKEQLKNISRGRNSVPVCFEPTKSDLVVPASNSVTNVSSSVTESVPSTSFSVPSTSFSSCSDDKILGERTRTEFKRDSYELLVDSSASAIQNEVLSVDGKDTETKTESVNKKTRKTRRGVVDFEEVDNLVSSLCCPQCKNTKLSVLTDSKKPQGLAVYAQVFCSLCEEPVAERYLASKDDKSKSFSINSQAVYSSLSCGLGSSTFNNFCENMDLPGLHHKTFHKHANKLYTKLDTLEERVFSETVKYVHQVHAQHFGITVTDDDILDISVSFDGTWLTRGHSSHIGVGCVVDLLTGLCVDAHVMCTYCQVCEATGKKLVDKPEEYAWWIVQHMDTCDKNFKGSSGMMEVEAARVIWWRSVQRHKLRYTVLLSDGDTKTFAELSKIKPYGDDVDIDKEECINHVSKRLGTALRNLVTDCRKRGVTLGGRGKGQLTQNAIRKLTIYYNRAIWCNNSVDSMKKAVMSSLYHCFSTDARPRHELCPPGVDSWCFFQEALAKHQVPGPHETLIHTPLNSTKLTPHLMPIYERLSEEQLLNRCVAGKTQNNNECLHSLIWSRCAKDRFASRRRVHFAVVTAIREFNFGSSAAQDTATFFGLATGHHMKRLGTARMQKRVRNSLKYKRDKQNKRRDKVRAAKLKRHEELLELEGGPAYAAGQF